MSVETVSTHRNVIRGFHIYSATWTPVTDELLHCKRQIGNAYDRYAVAVVKPDDHDAVVGHLPRKISLFCSLFLRRGSSITCQVIRGRRQRSVDLPQGGLEIPCLLIIKGKKEDVTKLMDKLNKHLEQC